MLILVCGAVNPIVRKEGGWGIEARCLANGSERVSMPAPAACRSRPEILLFLLRRELLIPVEAVKRELRSQRQAVHPGGVLPGTLGVLFFVCL